MKTTGIVRKVDELGRIVIPKETREQLYIAIKDPLEIFLDEEQAALRAALLNLLVQLLDRNPRLWIRIQIFVAL